MDDIIMWSPGVSLDEVEKQVILKAFRHFRGNKTVTAQALGISIRTLESRFEKYEADKKGQDERDAVDRIRREKHAIRSRYGNLPPPDQASDSEEDAESAGNSSTAGVRMEPASGTPTQQSVPVSQRPQVQSVLPKPVAAGHSRGRR